MLRTRARVKCPAFYFFTAYRKKILKQQAVIFLTFLLFSAVKAVEKMTMEARPQSQ
jgi:hypothetical protein